MNIQLHPLLPCLFTVTIVTVTEVVMTFTKSHNEIKIDAFLPKIAPFFVKSRHCYYFTIIIFN